MKCYNMQHNSISACLCNAESNYDFTCHKSFCFKMLHTFKLSDLTKFDYSIARKYICMFLLETL